MTEINFNMEAYSYTTGLRAISLMYEAAKGALYAQYNDIEDSNKEYNQHLEEGGKPIGEWDGENRLWDQEDAYRLEQLALEDAIEELCVATLIATYHLWERHIPNPRNEQRNHQKLISDAEGNSISLHPDINALCYLANYLKHGNKYWLGKLSALWPDRFSSLISNSITSPAAFRKLKITDNDVAWFIEIASASERSMSIIR